MVDDAIKDEFPTMTLQEFLATKPPGSFASLSDLCRWPGNGPDWNRSDVRLHCETEQCSGERRFSCQAFGSTQGVGHLLLMLCYVCSDCCAYSKSFALGVDLKYPQAFAVKFGEFPPYGVPLPSQLDKLVGGDRDLFRRGYRCEKQSLGIGAFAYYRRVVEDQFKRILEEVTKVAAEDSGCPAETIAILKQAASETQFNKAVSIVKDVFPPMLFYRGHNPMTLLHAATSAEMHSGSDEDCLERAHEIRLVLAHLAERIATARRENSELQNAFSTLFNRQKKPTKPAPET